MPFSSLTGAGFEAHGALVPRSRKHPHPVRSMLETPAPAQPTDTIQPVFPPAPPGPLQTFDQYVAGQPFQHTVGGRLENVVIKHPRVMLHADWAKTAIAPALVKPTGLELAHRTRVQGAALPVVVDINAITPSMIERLAPPTRASLMDALSTVEMRISWRDPLCPIKRRQRIIGLPIGGLRNAFGKSYRRRKILGFSVGRHYKVDGATGLTMRMAQDPNHKPFCDTMASGLKHVAPTLRGRPSTCMFSMCDVATVLGEVLPDVPQMTPSAACDTLDAASELMQRYFEEACTDSPDTIRVAYEKLMRALAPMIQRDPDHVGIFIGVLLTGVAKYGGDITIHDNHQRWRVASAVNLLWAMTSFLPTFLIAGPAATGVVAAGVVYDRFSPVRDYTTLLARFEAELTQLLLGKKVDWLPEEGLGRLFMRVRQVLKASAIPC